MTEPRMHAEEPAEGAEQPGDDSVERTPHSEQPAEGVEQPPADGDDPH